jgi:hypothetical protein
MQHSEPHATPSRNKSGATRNIVTGGRAAKALKLNRSTLSRYLKTYPELNCSDDPTKILVDIDELKQHRAENVNLVKSGNHAGALFDERAPDDFDDDLERVVPQRTPHAVRSDAPRETSGYGAARARREEALAQKIEREEAMALGQLIIKDAVDAAIGDALITLRDKLLSPDLDLCEALARCDEPTKVLTMLRSAMRGHLEKLTESFANADTGGAGDPLS